MITNQYLLSLISGAIGLAMGVGLFWSVTGECMDEDLPQAVQPGEFSSISEEAILGITYTTTELTWVAQRSDWQHDFAVQVTFADERPPQHCTMEPGLNGILNAMAFLWVQRSVEFTTVETNYPLPLGVITINTYSTDEEGPPWLFYTTPQREVVALKQYRPKLSFETTIPVTIFDQLQAGCTKQVPA